MYLYRLWNWYLVVGKWCLVFGFRVGVWYRRLVFGVGVGIGLGTVLGIGILYLVFGIWYLVFCILGFGYWVLVLVS